MTKAILVILIMTFILCFFILVVVANFATETWRRQKQQTKEIEESVVELLNYILRIDEVREKVAEAVSKGESEVDLSEVLK